MGAFIGYGDVGIWTSNGGRDAFLDWFAAHRCRPHDARWEYCRSEEYRWTGCCIELEELIPQGEILVVSNRELADAAVEFGVGTPDLLIFISQITRREWHHTVDSEEALHWGDPQSTGLSYWLHVAKAPSVTSLRFSFVETQWPTTKRSWPWKDG